MNEKELLKLIKKGESETLEFKENFGEEVIETAVAFSNKDGGIILVGVSDKGEIKGVSIGKETLKEWSNKISQTTEPTLIPEIESCKLKGKTIVVIKIKESPLKPVSYKGVCFMRIKNSNKKLTPKEISELHLQTIGSSWDSFVARDSKIEDIDFGKVEEYIKLANQTGRRKITEKPLEVLKKLDLIKDGKPTWAAILLFGKNPQKFVPQAKIHCGRFKDEVTIIDDELIEGSIIDQIDKAMDFVKRHLKVEFVITGRPRREQIWEYPLEAIREAIINAVCHSDYTEASDIQVRIYDDRLIVWNPGKLPIGITIEDLYRPHKSVLRNRLIAQIFFDIGLIERWGTGIQRIIDSCQRQNLPIPIFEEYQGFRVIFRKPYAKEELKKLGLNDRQIKAVEYVEKRGSITNREYQKLTLVSRKTATRDLTDLVKRGILNIVGRGKREIKYTLLLRHDDAKMTQKMTQKKFNRRLFENYSKR
jgi:ATP-dependent DNA helicase RecG